jgi:protein-tyrosine phosphatase
MPRFVRLFLPLAVFILMSSCTADNQQTSSLKNVENFRDLGGYRTGDNRRIKAGLLYRSGHLHDMGKEDEKLLKEWGIHSVADFRGPSEIEKEPDNLPDGIEYESYPVDIAGSDIREKIIAVIRGESDMDMNSYMLDINRRFVLEYSDTYGRWLHDLSGNPDPSPQIFHCTAGKDRAGFAAAVLLRILGVPRDEVMKDYLESNRLNEEYIEKTIRKIRILSLFKNDGEIIRPLLIVKPQYLQTAFSTIDTEWGSFENYVHQGLRLDESDIQALKDRFLE